MSVAGHHPFLTRLDSPRIRSWYASAIEKCEVKERKLEAAEKVAALLNPADWEAVKTYLSLLLLHTQNPAEYAQPDLPPHLHPFGIVFSPIGGEQETDNLTTIIHCLE